ncbi:MAG: response regulator transcription factor [Nevskia sp.]|nr:response regulator transcription factor [Nevskia sp.]
MHRPPHAGVPAGAVSYGHDLANFRPPVSGGEARAAVARLLLIDDDRKLSRMLAEFLGSHGFSVSLAHDGAEGAERARGESWDLILLDVMLPCQDGFETLRRLRAFSQVPVLMLTARGGDEDRIHGLEGGADDYVPKTASSRELLARIRAVLRRTAHLAAAPPAICVDGLSIEPAARAASLDRQPLALTPVEFDLLLALARRKGQVCSREQLLEQVRDRQFEAFDRSIDVHVASLRRKLGDDPRAPRFIRTVRAAGYLLVDAAAQAHAEIGHDGGAGPAAA